MTKTCIYFISVYLNQVQIAHLVAHFSHSSHRISAQRGHYFK